MKEIIGDLICPTVAGDDAHTTYGRCMAIVLHAALPGDGLDAVPFLLNSLKDTALARILEQEAVLGVKEGARDLTMPEWVKHCADLRAGKSLSVRAKNALTLQVNDFFHHETWVPVYPAAGSGPGGVDLPPTKCMREPTSLALLQLAWAGDFAFLSGDSLAATARPFGYTGSFITSNINLRSAI